MPEFKMLARGKRVHCRATPLEHEGVLAHVLSFLTGEGLFVTAVSSSWKVCFETLSHKSSCTTYAAALASPSRVQLAHACGLQLNRHAVIKVAGLYADIDTLLAALHLGLSCSSHLARSAVRSRDVEKVRLLRSHAFAGSDGHNLPDDITAVAASTGSIEMLRMLRETCVFDRHTSRSAAQRPNNAAMLQYLLDEGCPWFIDSCSTVAETGDLKQLQWVHQHASPLTARISQHAARSGSVQVFEFLQQQGAVFDADTLVCAAADSHLQLCKWLRATAGCEWSCEALSYAAECDSLETVRWLLDSGCECDPDELYMYAAVHESDTRNVLRYLLEAGVHAEPARLTATLKQAGLNDMLDAAKLLRQHGAAWPDNLLCEDEGISWSGESLAWARAEGCTAPTEV
jgi:hypothetical protein